MDKLRKREYIVLGSLVALIIISAIYLNTLKKKEAQELLNNVVNNKPEVTEVTDNTLEDVDDLRKEKARILKLIEYKAIDSNSDVDEEAEEEEEIEEEIDEEEVIEEEKEEEEDIKPQNNYASYNGDYVYCNNMNFSYLDEPGWMISYDDGTYTSILGLDVSEYNGYVDFYSLKQQGFDFVILRVGWRGSTEGGIYKDKNFEDYYAEAVNAGLNIGYYFFSQAVNDDEAIEEAEFVLDQIAGKQCNMFVAYDMETSIDRDGRSDYLLYAQYTSNALSFSNCIANNGYKPMVYTNLDWAYNYYDCSAFNDNDIAIWLAQYSGYPSVSFGYAMWQYTASASISGVALKGMTDVNLMLVEK